MEVEIGGRGGDWCGWGGRGGDRWSRWRSVIHGSWIMSLVGDRDGDGWIWLERLGFSGFQWGWVVVVEIDVAMEKETVTTADHAAGYGS